MYKILIPDNVINKMIKNHVITEVSLNPLNPYSNKEVDPTSMVTDKSGGVGSSKARLEYLKGHAQKNLGKLGIYGLENYMDTQGIFTAKRIKEYPKPFNFSFQTETDKFKGQAKYNPTESEKKQTIVLDFISEDGSKKLIEFTQESIKRPFMGKSSKIFSKWKGDKRALVGLQEDSFFEAIITDMGGEPKVNDQDKETEENKFKVGDTVNFVTDDNKKGRGKITKIDGDTYRISDKKGNEIGINKKNIKGDVEEKGEEKIKEGNYYNGKDLKEVNEKLLESKNKIKFFDVINQYKNDEDFQKVFLDSIIDSTKSIRVNKKPLLKTLIELKGLGLLEEDVDKAVKYKLFKKNFRNFLLEVMFLFSKVSKSGKESKTFSVIKNFLKDLYNISIKGKTNGSDPKIRNILYKKLLRSFILFKKEFRKLPEMSKGGNVNKKKGKELKVKSEPKSTMSNTVESFINSISKNIILINEEDGDENKKEGDVIKIKVLSIGIPRGDESGDKSKEDESKGNKKTVNLFSDKAVKSIKAILTFEDEEDEGIFKKSIKSEISNGLSKGIFFARLSKKPKGSVLVVTKSNKAGEAFFTLHIENAKSIKYPNQWVGEVTVGDKAMGDKDFKGVKATIKNVKILSK